jgi:spore coat polysaccharide biosynthesis protein SpsF (cytidylyltransferase family)
MVNNFNRDAVGIVIQARMGSNRLRGKSLMKVGSKPLINHVVTRVQAADMDAKIVLATSSHIEDDILVEYVLDNFNIEIYRGSPLDVRSRFIEVGRKFQLETIVRITADDPFKDPSHIRNSVSIMKANDAEYYNNYENHLFPIGLDVECFKTSALIANAKAEQLPESIEHVTTGLRNDIELKKIYADGFSEFSDIRLTIDYQSDLDYCNNLIRIKPEMGDGAFNWETTRSAILELAALGESSIEY